MRNIVNKIFTTVCLVTIASALNACGTTETQIIQPEMIPQYQSSMINEMPQSAKQILVKFKNTLTKSQVGDFHSKYGTKTVKVLPVINVHVIEMATMDLHAAQAVKFINNDPSVLYAETNNVIGLTPEEIGPIYSIQNSSNLSEMVGKKMSFQGVYQSSRSGSVLQTTSGKVSIVDVDGTVVTKLPNTTNGTRISISGVVKKVKGFNQTEGIGIMPITMKKA